MKIEILAGLGWSGRIMPLLILRAERVAHVTRPGSFGCDRFLQHRTAVKGTQGRALCAPCGVHETVSPAMVDEVRKGRDTEGPKHQGGALHQHY